MPSVPTYLLKRILKDNHDVRRNPDAVAYLIDSDERLVYWPIEPLDTKHDGFAIYVELSGVTRAIYRPGQPTTRAWGSQLVHNWLDAVHEGRRK